MPRKFKSLAIAFALSFAFAPARAQWQPSGGLIPHNHTGPNDGGTLSNLGVLGYVSAPQGVFGAVEGPGLWVFTSSGTDAVGAGLPVPTSTSTATRIIATIPEIVGSAVSAIAGTSTGYQSCEGIYGATLVSGGGALASAFGPSLTTCGALNLGQSGVDKGGFWTLDMTVTPTTSTASNNITFIFDWTVYASTPIAGVRESARISGTAIVDWTESFINNQYWSFGDAPGTTFTTYALAAGSAAAGLPSGAIQTDSTLTGTGAPGTPLGINPAGAPKVAAVYAVSGANVSTMTPTGIQTQNLSIGLPSAATMGALEGTGGGSFSSYPTNAFALGGITYTPSGWSGENLVLTDATPTDSPFGLNYAGSTAYFGFVTTNNVGLEITTTQNISLHPLAAISGLSWGTGVNISTGNADGSLSVYGVIKSSTTQGSTSTGSQSATCTNQHCTLTPGAVTSVTYTFGTAWTKAPDCVAITNASVPVAISASATTTAITITSASALTGDTVTFMCMGAP